MHIYAYTISDYTHTEPQVPRGAGAVREQTRPVQCDGFIVVTAATAGLYVCMCVCFTAVTTLYVCMYVCFTAVTTAL